MGKLWLGLAVVVVGLAVADRAAAQDGSVLPYSLRFKPSSSAPGTVPIITVPGTSLRPAPLPSGAMPSTIAPGTTMAYPHADTYGTHGYDSCDRCHHRERCGDSCGCRRGFLHRLREWLSYRAMRVPRECHCHHTCTPCVPPAHAYLCCRYPHDGHAPVLHAFPPPRGAHSSQGPLIVTVPARTTGNTVAMPALRGY
jgi:hypothetical protein